MSNLITTIPGLTNGVYGVDFEHRTQWTPPEDYVGYCLGFTLSQNTGAAPNAGVELKQTGIVCEYVNENTYLTVGGYCVSGTPGSTVVTIGGVPRTLLLWQPTVISNSPYVLATIDIKITVKYKNSVGTIIETQEITLYDKGIKGLLTLYGAGGYYGGIFATVPACWEPFAATFTVPVDAATVDVHYFIKQDLLASLNCGIDVCYVSKISTVGSTDEYLYIDREIIGFSHLSQDPVKGGLSFFLEPPSPRGQLGSWPADHKIETVGRILKVVGGASKAEGHPLNILMRLLVTTEEGVANGPYDVQDGYGLAIPEDQIDIAAIESLRDNTLYTDQRAEFRFTQGMGNFKEWAETEIMKVFGYRWAPGENGKISVARIAVGMLDQERSGVFSAGPVFTPTTSPEWPIDLWNTKYLWIKELAEVWQITDCSATALTLEAGAPTSGTYTCAIINQATVPYVATVEDRDVESLPSCDYENKIVNSLDWKFDYDPSNSVDNRLSTRLLSLVEHNEATFFDVFAGSSLERYKKQSMSIKSIGLRGVGAAKFASGYDLGGNIHARRTGYDFIRRWREMLPVYKFTSGAKYFNLDGGDLIRVKNSKLRDLTTGVAGIDKLCQVQTLRFDTSKKKLSIEAVSLSDIKIPTLKSNITFPTPQAYHYSIRKATADTIKSLGVQDYPTQISDLWFVCQSYKATTQLEADQTPWSNLYAPDFTEYRHTNVYVSDKFDDALRNMAFAAGSVGTPSPAPDPVWTASEWVGKWLWFEATNTLCPITANTTTTITATGAPTSGTHSCCVCTVNDVANIWGKVAETNDTFVFFLWKAGLGNELPDGPAIKITRASWAYNPLTGDFQEDVPIYKFYVGQEYIAQDLIERFSHRTTERVINYKIRQFILQAQEE